MAQNNSAHNILARLRLSVLASGEALPEKYWDSRGMSEVGQNDLRTIFPRTSMVAAATHASVLAQSHHDELTRATGVYHLFRLPTDVDASLHRQQIASVTDDKETEGAAWSELSDLPKQEVSAQEGAVNLGALSLVSKKDISKIANTYKAAFDAGLNCVPYFTIKE